MPERGRRAGLVAGRREGRHCFRALTAPLGACILAAVVLAGPPRPSPRFEDYRVATVYKGPVKPMHVADPSRYGGAEARCIRGEAPEGYVPGPVNFAGHFVIEACTCGSGCHSLYIWDAITGRFYGFFPSTPIDVGPYEAGGASPPLLYRGEEFRADSSLLILEGCFEDTCDCARRYYQWDGAKFKLISQDQTPLPRRCAK